MENVTWNFHMDDLWENARYNMILGQDFLSEIQMYLCFSHYTNRESGGTYKECTTSMKDVNKVHIRMTTEQLEDKRF